MVVAKKGKKSAAVEPAVAFGGFSTKALTFFRQLEKNNDRVWFGLRKELFETEVRGPMLQLVGEICDDLRGFAVDYVVDPKKAIFRIHRDTRFSKDKTPYKAHIGAAFGRKGLPRHMAGEFYFGFSHKGLDVAGGMYMPGAGELMAVRSAIAEAPKAFEKLVSEKSLKKVMGEMKGERLSRVPKGFAADDEAGEWLRYRQFYFHTMLPTSVALGAGMRKEVVNRFKKLLPFVEFLNDAVAEGGVVEGEDETIPKRPAAMF